MSMNPSRLLPLIGIVIFLYLLSSINLPEVAHIILKVNLLIFGIAILVTAVDITLKAFKWKLIFSIYNIPVPYSRFLSSWIIGLSLSMITPGKVGDFGKAYYLKDKAPLGKSLTTVMAARIIDLITLFILAIIGLTIFATTYSPNTIILTITYFLFAVFLIGITLLSKQSIATRILKPFFVRLVPSRYKPILTSVYGDFYSGVGLILGRKKMLVFVILITLLIWLGTVLALFLVAQSLGFDIPYDFLLIVFPVITLLEALPISFSGVGTRDATLIFFFGFIMLSAEAALSISLLYLLMTYIFVVIGFWLWHKNPIRR